MFPIIKSNTKEVHLCCSDYNLIKEDEIGLVSLAYKELFGIGFGKGAKSQPHKRGIVKVKNHEESGLRVVYLLFRGANYLGTDKTRALVHPRTLSRLGVNRNGNTKVTISAANPLIGRFNHYWQHPDNATRVAFKIGAAGIFFGIISLFDLLLKWATKVLYEVGILVIK